MDYSCIILTIYSGNIILIVISSDALMWTVINIVFSPIQEDQQTAANHMYIAALAVAAVAVAFAISIAFTDRPPQPKSSQE